MTKLPETISKRFNVITGKEVPLGCMEDGYPRGSGRTTFACLKAITIAMEDGSCFLTDHQDYPTCGSHQAALHLCETAKLLVDKIGLQGFSFETKRVNDCSHLSERSWGCLVKFSPYKEVHYDLRK